MGIQVCYKREIAHTFIGFNIGDVTCPNLVRMSRNYSLNQVWVFAIIMVGICCLIAPTALYTRTMSPCLRSISINVSRPGKQPVSSNICFNMACNFAAPKPGFDLRYSRAFSMMIDSMASSAKPSETLRLLYACRVKPNSPHRVPKPWLWHSVRSKLTVWYQIFFSQEY